MTSRSSNPEVLDKTAYVFLKNVAKVRKTSAMELFFSKLVGICNKF